MTFFLRCCTLCLGLLLAPKLALAIPPPEVLSTIGTQTGQIISLLGVGASLGFGVAATYINHLRATSWKKLVLTGLVILSIIALALSVAYAVGRYQAAVADQEYAKEVTRIVKENIDRAAATPETPISTNSFFSENADLPVFITNEAFFELQNADPFVLDAREDEEYAIGHFDGSTHIRFADILNGAWNELPTDRIVYILCWSGIRGSEVAQFLRDRGIVAQYLEDGANGWVEFGGAWIGEIAFLSKYTGDQFTKTFETDEIVAAVASGTLLIDARSEDHRTRTPIESAIPISIIFTPSDEIDAMFKPIPTTASAIVICDDYVNCFDAKIIGVRLEARGNTFLGRYAKPWEYSTL